MANEHATASLPLHKVPTAGYFEAVAARARQSGLLDESHEQTMQAGLNALLLHRLRRYTMEESSTVPTDDANLLVASIVYTLGMALGADAGGTAGLAVDPVRKLLETPVETLYAEGRRLIGQRVHSARRLWQAARQRRIATPNRYYNETLNRGGILAFFSFYQPDFAAHSTPVEIDYPLCLPVSETGVVYMRRFLERLLLETRVVRRFSPAAVHRLHLSLNPAYAGLPINLYEPVALCALACCLTGADPAALVPHTARLRQMELQMNRPERAAALLKTAVPKLAQQLGFVETDSAVPYLAATVRHAAPRVAVAARAHQLPGVFGTAACLSVTPLSTVRFTGNTRMEDENFRTVLEEITSCRHLSDKLVMLQELPSLGDLADALDAGALTDKELPLLYEALGPTTAALLQEAREQEKGTGWGRADIENGME